MDLKRNWALGWSSCGLFLLSLSTSAQMVKRQTLSSLGPQIMSDRITLQSCIGQPSMVGVSHSESFTLRAGFIQPPMTLARSLFAVDLEVFPNPFQSEFIVVTSFFPGDEIRVTGENGDLVELFRASTYTSQLKINLQGVANGMYHVLIIRNNRVIQTKKIIKIE